jgi:Cu2+-exporting ATPase
MSGTPGACFHCGEALAPRSLLWTQVEGREVAVCCAGCRAAVEFIAGLGLTDFYRYRTAAPARPRDTATEWLAYDAPEVAEPLVRGAPEARSIVLLVDGLTCAACGWLISRALLKLPGVARVSVNAATGRAQVVWDHSRLPLSRVLGAVEAIGYHPRPLTPDAAACQVQDERRAILKRLAVAGLGMMQVMMFAVAMYAGSGYGMDVAVRSYLRIVSLMVATPVMLYGGWPFFVGAATALRARSVTMDVPVSAGLLLAYGASVFDTWRGAGEVYFDSVTMFIFFLTVARHVEMIARHRSSGVTDSLSRLLPVTAHRIDPGAANGDAHDGAGAEHVVDIALAQLRRGDRLLVRVGEVFPADGELLAGGTRVDESMLTGESAPVPRTGGERVSAGTINVDAPVRMRVIALGSATVLANIVALLDRAQAERPRVTRAADRTAARFLVRVLIGAALVCLFWCLVAPERAFAATLAVLVVACPCALSLATLVAVASGNAALARRGVLVTNPDAIEGLAKATRIVFDKTGTLTEGRVSVDGCGVEGAMSAAQCRSVAAALEAASEHPIGRAFVQAAGVFPPAEAVRIQVGGGVEGSVGGRVYRIGTPAFVRALRSAGAAAPEPAIDRPVVLGDEDGVLAWFDLADTPRPGAAAAIRSLQRLGLAPEILSGDAPSKVASLARHCGIGAYRARQTPLEKLEWVRAMTAGGAFVAMVGDGINDAPVLAGAGVSIAMGRGSALALASADLILVGDRLEALPEAVQIARRARSIIRQNLVWAAAYNLTAMPLAAMGWVPPWMAAIGMSASSILVVLNSMRVMRPPRAAPAPPSVDRSVEAAALAARSPS